MKPERAKNHERKENLGEGDRESARRYNEKTREYVKSGKVDEAAKQAGKQNPREAEESEHKGRERAREVDPAVHRDYRKAEK